MPISSLLSNNQKLNSAASLPSLFSIASNFRKFIILFLLAGITGITLMPTTLSAEILYSGLIGGIDRGDSASLPTLGLKFAFDAKSGWEITYARGGIRSEGSYFEKERLLAFQYRTVSTGSILDTSLGGGFGLANASSEAQGNTESVTNLAFVVGIGSNLAISSDFAFKMGLDSFLVLVPNTLPLYAIGVRNFWYIGVEISL